MSTSFGNSYQHDWQPIGPARTRRVGLPHFLTVLGGGLVAGCPWLPWINCNVALAVFSGDIAVNGWGNTLGFSLPMVNFRGMLTFDGMVVLLAGLTIMVLGFAHIAVRGVGGLLVTTSLVACALMFFEYSTLVDRLRLNWFSLNLPFVKGEAGLGIGLYAGVGGAMLALTTSLLTTLLWRRTN